PGFHTRCYVEWEEYPRSRIIAAQRAGYFAPAPIWDDVTTFDAKPLAGAIDTLIGGYPCQGESLAGKRLGVNGERWLWDDFARIIGELGSTLQWCFFENVRGHLSSGLQTVLRSLRGLGFSTSVGIFSAGETGASHERQRVFIVAYRNRQDGQSDQRKKNPSTDWRDVAFWRGGAELADTPSARSAQRRPPGQSTPATQSGSGVVSESERPGRGDVGHPTGIGRDQRQPEPSIRSRGNSTACTGGQLDNAQCDGRHERGCRDNGGNVGIKSAAAGGDLADTSGSRIKAGGSEQDAGNQGIADQLIHHRRPLFPPGPAAASEWSDIITGSPDLAPAISLGCIKRACDNFAALVETGQLAETQAERRLCGMADELATRTRGLKLLGNGVFPLAAGHAWRTLSPAFGLRPMDLGAASGHPTTGSAIGHVRGGG
ncbi:MAG: DNA cytosine methyltransferase, partial [Sulfitobacter sp.]